MVIPHIQLQPDMLHLWPLLHYHKKWNCWYISLPERGLRHLADIKVTDATTGANLKLRLSEAYTANFDTKKLLKSFTALAYVPPEDAYDAFNTLKEFAIENEQLEQFISYNNTYTLCRRFIKYTIHINALCRQYCQLSVLAFIFV